MRLILLSLLLVASLVGQNIVPLSSPPPPGVPSLSATASGFGTNTFIYHVIAKYPIGRGDSKATQVQNVPLPSVGNPTVISWATVPGATGYDVLRTTTPGLPSSCTCALATSFVGSTFTDSGQTLSAYNLASGPSAANATISIDNLNFSTPIIQFAPYNIGVAGIRFNDGTTQTTAGGGGGGGSVTHTGPLTAGRLLQGNGLADITVGNLSGDVTTSGSLVTNIAAGVIVLADLAPAILTGNGATLCTSTGAAIDRRVLIFDAVGNCVGTLVSIDSSGNISTPGTESTGVGGTIAGANFYGTQATNPTIPNATGFAGIGVGTGAIGASYALLMPVAGPAATNSTWNCPALALSYSQCTFSVGIFNSTVNTATAAMTLDLSASTVANAFRVPVGAGLTAGANGVLAYDSTAGSSHARIAGADAILGGFAGAPAGSKCVQTSGTTGLLVEAAAACGTGGVTTTGSPANGQLTKFSGASSITTATETDVSATEYAAGGGTAQAQTVTLAPAITSLTNGLQVCWLPTAANTATAPTLAVNGLTATPITKLGTSALVAGDLTTTAIACARYDGIEFQLLNPQSASPSASSVSDATVANTVTETTIIGNLVGSKTTAANYFTAGTTLYLWSSGYFSSAVADTLNIKIKAGSTVVGATGAITPTSQTNVVYRLYALVTCRTTGASGTFIVNTIFESTGSALTPNEAKILNTATVTLDTTATINWDITATWGTASASDTITGTNFALYSPTGGIGGGTGGASITTFSSTGANTFTKPGVCNTVEFIIWGAGGSGAGGATKATSATVTLGGSGGGGGAKSRLAVKCSDLTAPIVVNVGAGGIAVAAATNGNPGGNSSVTSNGVQILFAGGGGAGFTSTGVASISGGGGGGAIGIGGIGGTGASAAGLPGSTSGSLLSGAGVQGTIGAAGSNAEFGGASGGGVSTGGGFDGGSSIYGGPGGGSGGMVTGASSATAGKAGGAPQSYTVAGGGAGGAACNANNCTATNGTAGTAGSSQLSGSGGGGGGACFGGTAATTCTAGNGMAGGAPGAGGGGGGAADTNAGTSNAGTGGAGGNGLAIVIVN